MDVNAITTIISTVGFPIFCCVAMFWYLDKERQAHKEESTKFAEVVERNTLALQELSMKLGGDSDV